MSYFHFTINSIQRSRGRQATSAAAYCAGETIRDERSGKVHNHSQRCDVRHTEILLPSRFGDAPMEWARNRASLWNTAEAAEKRRDSRVAREYQLSLPAELNPAQRLGLARIFARELSDRYGVAVDLAIHDPKPGRDSPNFHAHLLTTTREVTPTGLGAKTGLDLGGVPRAKQGLPPHVEEYSTLRERWATLTNEALQAANIPTRVDHRSLAAQGIGRSPVPHIPMEFYRLEREGMPKEAAERLRAEYRARITAYRERSAGAGRSEQDAASQLPAPTEQAAPQLLAPTAQTALPQPTPAERVSAQPESLTPATPKELTPRNPEEIRRRAVQAWLQMRSKEAESSQTRGKSSEVSTERGQEEGREQ